MPAVATAEKTPCDPYGELAEFRRREGVQAGNEAEEHRDDDDDDGEFPPHQYVVDRANQRMLKKLTITKTAISRTVHDACRGEDGLTCLDVLQPGDVVGGVLNDGQHLHGDTAAAAIHVTQPMEKLVNEPEVIVWIARHAARARGNIVPSSE